MLSSELTVSHLSSAAVNGTLTTFISNYNKNKSSVRYMCTQCIHIKFSARLAVAMQRTQSSTCCFTEQFSKHCFLVSKHLTFLFVLLTVSVFLSIASWHLRCCKVWCRKPVCSLAGDTHTHTHTRGWCLFRGTSGLIFPFLDWKMKVTVSFGRTGVVVPCKEGWTVRDLIQQATQRYRKLLEQASNLYYSFFVDINPHYFL